MAAAPSRGACPPTSLSSTRLTRTSPSIRSWPLARRVWAAGAAQRVGPAGGGGVSCAVECCMCPLEGRQVVPGSGSRLRFLTQKQGGRQNPSLRFLMPEVLNAHPELYTCAGRRGESLQGRFVRNPVHSFTALDFSRALLDELSSTCVIRSLCLTCFCMYSCLRHQSPQERRE